MNRLMKLSMIGAMSCAMNAARAQLVPPTTDVPKAIHTIALTRLDAPGAKVTFLGAATSAAPAAMREQLKLPRGVGLVVTSVEAGSGAEKAGVKQHDVIEKLNDQWLINAEQLAALLQSMKPGDEVSLAIIRQGQRQVVKAKLGEKDVEALPKTTLDYFPVRLDGMAANAEPIQRWNAELGAGGAIIGGRNAIVVRNVGDKQTTEWADGEVRITVERDGNNVSNLVVRDAKTGKTIFTGKTPAKDDPFFQIHHELADKIKKAIDAANRTPARIMGIYDTNRAPMMLGVADGGRGKVSQWQDADHVLLMRMSGKEPVYLLALSRKDGRTVFDGPVRTDEERKSLPGEISEKFEMILAQPDTAKEFGVTTGARK